MRAAAHSLFMATVAIWRGAHAWCLLAPKAFGQPKAVRLRSASSRPTRHRAASARHVRRGARKLATGNRILCALPPPRCAPWPVPARIAGQCALSCRRCMAVYVPACTSARGRCGRPCKSTSKMPCSHAMWPPSASRRSPAFMHACTMRIRPAVGGRTSAFRVKD